MDGANRFFLGFLVLALTAHANADTIIYEFSGIVPPGASSHSQVEDGESWTVVVEIDDTIADADPNVQRGSYPEQCHLQFDYILRRLYADPNPGRCADAGFQRPVG